VLEPAEFEHVRRYVVEELGLTDWLPLVFLEPLQAPDAEHPTGGVALALICQDSVVL
jgi:hypothetical protein